MASRIREMFSSNEDPMYRANYAQRQGLNSRSSNTYALKQHHGPLPIIELRVPMCCEKCKEKVQEELEDMDGVRSVVCDQFHQRVTVAGFVDPLRVLKRVKKVKKKSEFFTQGSFINKSTSTHPSTIIQAPVHPVSVRHAGQPLVHPVSVRHAGQPLVHPVSVRHAGQPLVHHTGQSSVLHRDSVRFAGQPPVHRDAVRYAGQPLVHGGPGLTRTNSFERGLARQPSFGKVAHYDGPRHHDFETRDLQRDYYGIRRMPSFKKHRYHDAEYVSMGDEFTPQFGESHYVHSQRPMLQSQVSFSKLPVRNPHYVKPVYNEY